ncbi:acylphosphatase [Halomonas binhaiensis]|uniref:acylphosphatase n=1 Tax=Halomonas binhaiensis TaxID=2562282 RepID=A0A5C1NJB0_9GAMM|nr:acylphosphatase [Halomonas binhaiensis]QEM81869.1 acylphosphatase [Halomonas binhaiensis]
MSATYCVRALVAGRVQGVYYRASTQRQALAVGLTGHAVNLVDGRVEVLLCGDSEAVDTVLRWLWKGPQGAQVTHVETEVVQPTPLPRHFHTG